MADEQQNIVIPDTSHVVPPRESNQNDVRSRIQDLIERPPEDEHAELDGNQESAPAGAQSDLDKPEKPDRENELGLSDAELDALDSGELEDEVEDGELVETLDAKTLAEKLDIPIDELYSMKFPYGEDGESITLGELKDAGIRAKGIDAESESLSYERDSFINDRMKSRSELQTIVSLLPEIPAELMQQAQNQQAITIREERGALLNAIPEWNDPGIEQQAKQAIMENISQYGFTETEASYMLDHRLVKLLHDYTRLRQKIVEPQAQISKMKKTTRRKPQSRQTRRRQQVDQANKLGRTDTRGAINALLPRT